MSDNISDDVSTLIQRSLEQGSEVSLSIDDGNHKIKIVKTEAHGIIVYVDGMKSSVATIISLMEGMQ